MQLVAHTIFRATREFNISLPEDRRLSLRIGLHVGDVVESKDGDISGDAVNVASRVEPLAEAGGVCLTRQAYDHVKSNKFELDLQSLGLKTLKNVREPVEVFKMVMPWENRRPQESARRAIQCNKDAKVRDSALRQHPLRSQIHRVSTENRKTKFESKESSRLESSSWFIQILVFHT